MDDVKKLKWRCRRGTLELDILCRRYLDRCYLEADEPERQAFLDLLDFEDSVLLHYLMGDLVPESASLKKLVEKICALKIDSDEK